MSIPILVYLAVVLLGGASLIVKSLSWLRLSTRERSQRLKERELVGAMPPGDAPIDDVLDVERARALDSIETQFSVTRRLLVPVIGIVMLLLLAIPFLPQMPAATISIVAAVLSVVLGVAARPIIENGFAGLVLSFSKSINIGDTVLLDGYYGTIEDISPTHTTVKIWDWRRLLLPNSRMLNVELLNYSLHDKYVWASVDFWVGYDTDLDTVRDIAINAAKQSDNWLVDTDCEFWVMALDKQGVSCKVAAWAETPSKAWYLRHDIQRALVREINARGIEPHTAHVDLRQMQPRSVMS